MRRSLSISLILIFWLGPLAAALPANGESRLPSCCRRHGAHHCAMSMRMATIAEPAPGSTPAWSAPSTCPQYPGSPVASTSTIHALASTQPNLPVLLVQAHTPAPGRASALLSPIRTRASRGPPASNLS